MSYIPGINTAILQREITKISLKKNQSTNYMAGYKNTLI